MGLTVIVLAIVSFTISTALRLKDRRDDKRTKSTKYRTTKYIIIKLDKKMDKEFMHMFYSVMPQWGWLTGEEPKGKFEYKCCFYGYINDN